MSAWLRKPATELQFGVEEVTVLPMLRCCKRRKCADIEAGGDKRFVKLPTVPAGFASSSVGMSVFQGLTRQPAQTVMIQVQLLPPALVS